MPRRPARDTHTVRPRWTWVALMVLLAGMVLIAVGNLRNSTAVVVLGLVAFAVGAAVAVYGGFFYDVKGGTSIRAQAHDAVEGTEREFPGPGTIRSESEVKQDVHQRWLSDGEPGD